MEQEDFSRHVCVFDDALDVIQFGSFAKHLAMVLSYSVFFTCRQKRVALSCDQQAIVVGIDRRYRRNHRHFAHLLKRARFSNRAAVQSTVGTEEKQRLGFPYDPIEAYKASHCFVPAAAYDAARN